MRFEFTKTEMEVIDHRLEVMGDVMYDVWDHRMDHEPFREAMEKALAILEAERCNKPGKAMNLVLPDDCSVHTLAIITECLYGNTLIDMLDDAVAEGQITRQKQAALEKAWQTATIKVEELCQDVEFR